MKTTTKTTRIPTNQMHAQTAEVTMRVLLDRIDGLWQNLPAPQTADILRVAKLNGINVLLTRAIELLEQTAV